MLPQGSSRDQALSTTTITKSPDPVGGSQSSRSEECTRACSALATPSVPWPPRLVGGLIHRVTALPAQAGSFSDDARPSEPRLRLRARSTRIVLCQRANEHCTHVVTWQREVATGTVMPSLGQVFRDRLATDTSLAGVAWMHRYCQVTCCGTNEARG